MSAQHINHSCALSCLCHSQSTGVLVAKAPALLACCVAAPGELNRDLRPHVDAVQEVSCQAAVPVLMPVIDMSRAQGGAPPLRPLLGSVCMPGGCRCVLMCMEVARAARTALGRWAQVVAAYEYYTMEWLQRSLREVAPQVRPRSFSTLDRR